MYYIIRLERVIYNNTNRRNIIYCNSHKSIEIFNKTNRIIIDLSSLSRYIMRDYLILLLKRINRAEFAPFTLPTAHLSTR